MSGTINGAATKNTTAKGEQGDEDERRHRRHDPPRAPLLVGREQRRDDRHEGRAQGARGDELEHQVRQPERGVERVELRAQPEHRGHDRAADIAEQAGQQERRADDQARPGEGGGTAHAGGWRRARGCASRYADRRRAGETWV